MELLKGKVAFITGGSRGIGYSIAKTYLDNGATVILCGSKQETADRAVEKLKAINPAYPVEGIAPDITDFASITAAINSTAAKYGKLDILVNNAGISAGDSIYNYNPESFDQLIKINVNAPFYTIRAAAPIMKKNGGGSIINTSSIVARDGSSAGVAYPTSKAALNGMTVSLARELARDNIRVNAVGPGITDTDMVSALPEQMKKHLVATIPLGRIGDPQDIANAFLYLASDLAGYVTGTVIYVDGCARV